MVSTKVISSISKENYERYFKKLYAIKIITLDIKNIISAG